MQTLLVHLISRVGSLATPAEFSEFLYRSRWAPLQGERERRPCYNLDEEGEEVHRVRSGITETAQGEEYINTAEAIANVLNDELMLNGVRLSIAAEYIEQIASYAVGVDDVGDFLYDCLDYDKIELAPDGDGGGGGEGEPLEPLVNDGSQDRVLHTHKNNNNKEL